MTLLAATPLSYQLLALRRYLRIGDSALVSGWSWTELEAATKKAQEPGRTLYAEAAKVQAAFAEQNPGFTLVLSPIRSLERQVRLWNNNFTTVQPAGERLTKDMGRVLQEAAVYPAVPSLGAVQRFRQKLRDASVNPEPSSAAPGTSSHGRGTAVDFVVKRGSVTVAGTSTSTIKQEWTASGWAAKLQQACQNTRLKGPLQMPYEPWHWTMDPTSPATSHA